ncbi:T9SS type B sorting domain-containing protein [Mucilaginibacter corticis]|uniref:T9SS type B sorting domain-containing protein n=1 Tax=Mucilaginibacter corticis TaxID=2597670 RepID=A0A556MV29_9SPHI|nr:MBG domain-containing protein [Mucilaginibacter corticis]TSJ43658.1 T9SS type B sorting domain-containing protein [Mucilaginibacter corticis]
MRKFLLATSLILFFCLFYNKIKAQVITTGTMAGGISSCIGNAASDPNLQHFTVSGNHLVGDVTATAPANFEISLNANGSYSNTLTLTQTGGVVNSIIYVRSAASAGVGNISGNVTLTSPNAGQVTIGVKGVINALPVVNAIDNQTVNSGEATTDVKFTGTAQIYSWTNDNTNIGLAANGTGNISSFTAINNTNSPQTAKITVTPKPAGFIYVVNAIGNSVSVINAVNNLPVVTIPIKDALRLVVSPDALHVYVLTTTGYNSSVAVIDAATNTVTATIDVGKASSNILISHDGTRLYLINTFPNTVTVVNTSNNSVIATVSVGQYAMQQTLSPNGNYLYVSLGTDLAVINTANNKVEKKIYGLVYEPNSFLFNKDGSILYAANFTNTVSVINTSNGELIASIPTNDNYPAYLIFSKDEKLLYVSNIDGKTITVINTNTNKVTANIPLGSSPDRLIMSPDGKYLYTTGPGSQNIFVISTLTNTVVSKIQVPGIPVTLALNNDGSLLYVADQAYLDNKLYVINTTTNTVVADIPVGPTPIIDNTDFTPGKGCDGLPVSFNITVNPTPPLINTVGLPNPVSTTYGTASVSSSFTVSGSNLSGPVTVTPPPGFEVSTDNINFSPTLTIGNTGNIASTLVYMRLAATTNAATYSGNVVLSSPGASVVNVPIGNSIVKPAPLNITGTYAKIYGDVLTNTTIYYNTPNVTFTNPDLKNGNSFNSIDISFGAGSHATDGAGTYNGTVTLSGFTGRNGYLSSNYIVSYSLVNLVVLPATLTITANNIDKPYGTTLADVTNSNRFTATGLKNGETISSVAINYGTGAEATATAGIYTGSVVAVNATGGTFAAGNYSVIYVPGNINVIVPPPPDITTVGTPQSVNTTYGTASPSSSFTVSGVNLLAGITVTPPAGFEVSTDGVHFSNTVTVGAAGTVAAVPVYIRLASITNAGAYSGDINLSSGSGSGIVTVPMPNSTVDKAPLTIFAIDKSKTYGDVLSGFTNSEDFAITAGSLKNGNIITLVSVIYGQGGAATDPVGYYAGSVKIIAVTGANGYDEDNYIVTFMPADIAVKAAPLIVAAGNYSKTYGTVISEDQPNSFAVGGLKNNETIENVKSTYGLGRNATDPVGIYKGSIIPSDPSEGTFTASNYAITYKPGDIEVTPAILTVTADDKTKNYGAANPTLTFTYSGFVNNETEAQLTEQPTITTTATTKSDGGVYPITISGGSAVNYTFNYISATLTINAPTVLVIPNTFTPNNDGVNDSWKIPALASYPDCLVQIFNRYGSKVYSSVGYPVPWDGTYEGLKVPDGVYYYIIDTKVLPGKASGYVNVIR